VCQLRTNGFALLEALVGALIICGLLATIIGALARLDHQAIRVRTASQKVTNSYRWDLDQLETSECVIMQIPNSGTLATCEAASSDQPSQYIVKNPPKISLLIITP